ncbi:hypothetical protein OA57_01460, partial [Chelonobacter oris]
TLNDGLRFQGDTGNAIAKKLNETLSIKGNVAADAEVTDKNLRVDNVNGDLILKMARDLTDLNSAIFLDQAGNRTVIGANGMTIVSADPNKPTVSLTENGLDNGGNVISNIGAGKNDADAVNKKQLDDAVKNVVDNAKTASVKAGNNTTVTSSVNPADANDTVYTVNAEKSTVTAGSDLVSVASATTEASNVTDYKIDLSEKAKAEIGAAKTEVKAADDEANVTVTPSVGENGQAVYEVALNKNLSVDSVKTGDVEISAGGINAGDKKISHVDAGTIAQGSKDAVNGGQLFNQGEGVKNIIGGNTVYDPETGSYTNNNIGGTGKRNLNDAIQAANEKANAAAEQAGKGWNLSVNNGVNAGNIAPAATVDLNNVDKNIVISKTENNVTFDLNKSVTVDTITANESIKVGDITVSKDGINAGNTVIGNVKAAEIKQGGTDAATTGQLYNNAQSIAKTLGGGATMDAGGNITAPTYNVVNGDPASGNSVQVYTVGDAINNLSAAVQKPLTFETDTGSYVAKLGSSIAVKGDGNNISTSVDANGNISVKMAEAPTFNTITANRYNVGDKTYIDGNGINANNQTVNNVADGEISATSKQAVNGSQLHATHQAINHVNNRIDGLAKDIDGVGATAAAMSSLPQAYLPGHSAVAVSGGAHGGQNALALGVSRISDNGKVIVKLNAAHNSRGDATAGVGVAYQW